MTSYKSLPQLVTLRLPLALETEIRADLERPHLFAGERVGFLEGGVGTGAEGKPLVLFRAYHPVPDDRYIDDPHSGARLDGEAIRSAMQRVLGTQCGLFHVHMHPFIGMPHLSGMDQREIPRLVRSFQSVGGSLPHGIVLFSETTWTAWVWLPGSTDPTHPVKTVTVGSVMYSVASRRTECVQSGERYARQSFLGPDSQSALEDATVGVVGLGGGGSHVVQQMAHVGIGHLRGFDGDIVTESNLNRLVGAKDKDILAETPKVEIAQRLVTEVAPGCDVLFTKGRWQDRPDILRSCDVVVGCVDSFSERDQLERFCRRYLIPYIDIGMDIHVLWPDPPRMAGQVLLSMPGRPCMWCWGILSESRLGEEARRYGDVGDRPQVVWPNGILASTAVGIVVDLLTGWTQRGVQDLYLSYDGNTQTLSPHIRLQFSTGAKCRHHLLEMCGDPVFTPLGSRET